MNAYQKLANQLDSLPNGYPPAEDGSHIRLLEKIFTTEEAQAAACLKQESQTVEEIAVQLDIDEKELRTRLKNMARQGLITVERGEGGYRFKLLPFVVGIYENQIGSLDEEMAQLFETYYQQSFSDVMKVQPQFHRVIPVNETIQNTMEIHPYESISDIVNSAQSWAVFDCICRKQKEMIGEPCDHPIDVCMALSSRRGAFENHPVYHSVTQEEAFAALKKAADAGLVHSVSNNQKDMHYICNCCTCSCGILRGIAKLGVNNVVARSAFVCTVNEDLCVSCGTCMDYCQFGALDMDDVIQINGVKCVGCGVCVPSCPSGALSLLRRPENEIKPIPETQADWADQRELARK